MIRLIEPEELAKKWHLFYKDIEKAIDHGVGESTSHDLFMECMNMNAQCWIIEDDKGNQGVCKLVDKHKDDLKDNEMSISGYILKSTTFVFISSVAQGLIKDFKNNVYTYEVDNDSTSSILLLTEAT